MFREEDLASRDPEMRGDDPFDPELLAEQVAHRLGEAARGAREPAQRQGEDALEFEHRLLVEDDGVEIVRFELSFLQAEIDGSEGKGGVVLAPGEALLLNGTDRDPVDDQRGGRVVIVGRDAEDPHQYWLLASGSARETANPSCSRRAARRARKTKGGSRTKYWTRRISVPISPASAAAIRRYAFHSLTSRACPMRRRVRGPPVRVRCAGGEVMWDAPSCRVRRKTSRGSRAWASALWVMTEH